jgi:nitronate monooxygenase
MGLRTPICDLLGIEVPILLAGMAGMAGPALVAAVSNAGGLGILGGHNVPPDELRRLIAETRGLTSRPFGINLLLPEDLAAPAPPEEVQDASAVQAILNPMRAEIGLAAKEGLPNPPLADILEKVEVLLESGAAVFSVGLGNPGPELVARCHAKGMRVIAMATNKEDALALEAAGVDAIVAQGGEAGGHRSHFAKPTDAGFGVVGTFVLVPEIVDAVRIPVIASGGIVDGRGVVAALTLGARAAMIGTRFLATQESGAVEVYKRALVAAASGDTTVTDVASGRYARVIRNAFTERYGDAPVLPFGWQGSAVGDLFQGARDVGDADYMGLWAGQGIGLIDDLPSAGELVARLVREAEDVLQRLTASP